MSWQNFVGASLDWPLFPLQL